MKSRLAIIGGSGIDDPKILKNSKVVDLDTPYGKPSDGLVVGEIGGREVIVLPRHGKNHTIPPTQVPFRANIWALKELGAKYILATTACGSLKEEIKPGNLVFVDQFIDFTRHRNLTFYDNEVVHTSMADPFCFKLRRFLKSSSEKLGIEYHEGGTVITIEGPRFSTRAESNIFRMMDADVINMSSVPEAALARELKICYASIAMATDYDCWREGESVTFEMILETMKKNAKNVKNLLLDVIPKIRHRQCACR